MNEELEKWIDQQETLPEHLQRWMVFEHPGRIKFARFIMHIGFFHLGKRLCGMRYENDAERAERLRKYWEQEKNDETPS